MLSDREFSSTPLFVVVQASLLLVASLSRVVAGFDSGEEWTDVVSKTVLADVVLVGTVGTSTGEGGKTPDSCAAIKKFHLLKGVLEREEKEEDGESRTLIVCHAGSSKSQETIFVEDEKFIIFLNSTESRDEDLTFHFMTSSPIPYTFDADFDIDTFLSDPSAGLPPAISVTGKTVIKESFGDNINITCSFAGFPTPRVQWRKDGAVLQNSEDIRIETNVTQSILKFIGLHLDHDGEYQCIVYNVFGSDNVTYTVESYKMHAQRCSDDSFCFGQGACFLSGGLKLCECREGYSGHRCQLIEGESNQPTFKPVESPRSVQTLLLIITIAVVTTGVIILIYASVRSFYVGSKYKKIKQDGTNQKSEGSKRTAAKNLKTPETNGGTHHSVVPIETVHFGSSHVPSLNRERLNGTSTPVNLEDGVWNSRGSSFFDAIEDCSQRFSTFPNGNKAHINGNAMIHSSPNGGVLESNGHSDVVHIKVSKI